MRLLVFTQKVDSKDPVLGFFQEWVQKMAERAKSVSVICLEKGDFDLPKNVVVYSLGKSRYQSKARYGIKFKYIFNLYKYLFLIRGSYDKVFAHMNEEYVLLAGWYWRLKNIPVYLWRNHPKGSLATRLAVWLSFKVFSTSKDSFTARFKKTVIMPVGYDETLYKPLPGVLRKKYSVLMLGRVSPVKRVDLALAAVRELVKSGGQVSLSIVGSAPVRDAGYYERLKKFVEENNLNGSVSFEPEVSKNEGPKIFNSHEVTLNLTESGSFDKTIAEAAACGSIPLVSNKSLADFLPRECITEPNPKSVAASIANLLDISERLELSLKLKPFIESQSLSTLMNKLFQEFVPAVEQSSLRG